MVERASGGGLPDTWMRFVNVEPRQLLAVRAGHMIRQITGMNGGRSERRILIPTNRS